MEMTIASVLSALIAYLGSGWIGLASSVLVLVIFLVLGVSLKRVKAKYAYEKSKQAEIEDHISNRDEAAKVEDTWNESQDKIEEIRAAEPTTEKKKRTWM